jgi:lipopolysaccharide/colanic/teichoic acid biosynthesis glycosyltransferase
VQVVGFLDDYLPPGTPVSAVGGGLAGRLGRGRANQALTVLGHPREARALAAEYEADLLIVVTSALTWESQQALARLGGSDPRLEVRLAPTQYDLSTADVQPAPLNYVPLLHVSPGRVTGIEAFLKRGLDASLALLLLVAMAPALAWVVLCARRRGVRPLAPRRPVLGKGGRTVHLRVLNPAVSNRLLLRGAPALLDVLRGEVALVGPRPIPVEQYAEDARARLLLDVKPGLTGPWRLAAADLAPGAHQFADVWWVRNWSLWQHLFVLFQSARAALASPRGGRRLERWGLARAAAGDAAVSMARP